MKQPAIFPIYLSEGEAHRLVHKHFKLDFERALRMAWGDPVLDFSATLLETGEVKLHVHYSSDTGFALSSGPLFRETCKPYDDEEFHEIVARRKFALATEEYERRESVRVTKKILEIQHQMFPSEAWAFSVQEAREEGPSFFCGRQYMIYNPPVDDLLAAITYGSRLYGTSTPTSDHDFKAVYLPSMRDLILTRSPKVLRFRFDKEGNKVSDSETMPDNGYEAEHTPVQKFVHDYLGGQAYAVETVFAVMHGAHEAHMPPPGTIGHRRACMFESLCRTLGTLYIHKNVNGMLGFAQKQVFDYVRRGERLNMAKSVLDVLQRALRFHTADGSSQANLVRLDSPIAGDALVQETILDGVARETGLALGSTVNNGRTMRTLKLNGREYLETTTLPHLINAVEKLCDQYGERSTRSSETNVDWKSLSHAVRVYQQVIELLETGFVTFPRPNAENLLKIRNGEHSLDIVKDHLSDLDEQVNEMLAVTTLPEVTQEFRAKVEDVLCDWLYKMYAI